MASPSLVWVGQSPESNRPLALGRIGYRREHALPGKLDCPHRSWRAVLPDGGCLLFQFAQALTERGVLGFGFLGANTPI